VVDAAAHEFRHCLDDALGTRNQDLWPFLAELAAVHSATMATEPRALYEQLPANEGLLLVAVPIAIRLAEVHRPFRV